MCGDESIGKISVLFVQFGCESKTVLKNKNFKRVHFVINFSSVRTERDRNIIVCKQPGPAHLVHIPPVAGIIVAAPDHIQLVQEGGHAVPGPPHGSVSQCVPGVAVWLIAVRLF